jgi:hypothetical protein
MHESGAEELARLRHSGKAEKRPLVSEDRKWSAPDQNDTFDPKATFGQSVPEAGGARLAARRTRAARGCGDSRC